MEQQGDQLDQFFCAFFFALLKYSITCTADFDVRHSCQFLTSGMAYLCGHAEHVHEEYSSFHYMMVCMVP